MTAVRYVDLRERHPTGIGLQMAGFVERMSPIVEMRRHRLRHWEQMVRGRPRFGYVSMLANRLVPVRKTGDEILHAGDLSLVPFFGEAFDLVEIWDTMPFERPDLYQRDLVSAFHTGSTVSGVLRAKRLVVHSPSTRENVQSFFGCQADLIPAGVDTEFFDIDPAIGKEPRSVLAVAAYYPQKNLENLIRGCGLAGGVLRLVGRRRVDTKLQAIANEYPGLRVEDLGYVDRDRLRQEYNRAAVYCSASTMEGFGLTPVEAMACGTLPVLSDIPTHNETAGDVGLFFDPLDVDDIGDAIEAGFTFNRRDNLRKAALRFSWETAIGEWVRLYRSLGVDINPIYRGIHMGNDARTSIEPPIRPVPSERESAPLPVLPRLPES